MKTLSVTSFAALAILATSSAHAADQWTVRRATTSGACHVGKESQSPSLGNVLGTFADKVAPHACRINHPRFFAFIPSAPTFLSVLGDFLCRLRPFGPKPVRRPVQCAEEGACGDGGVAGMQRSGAHSRGDEGADAALVAIPLGDDARAEAGRERVNFEVRRRSFDFVEQAQDMGDGHLARVASKDSFVPLGDAARLVLLSEDEIEAAALALAAR